MKIIVRPILDPQREIDLTQRLVAAIAEELWRLFGGNDTLNWIEAEWHLQRIVAQARVEARETAVVRVAPSAPDRAINGRTQRARREREAARLSEKPRPRNAARRAKEQRTLEPAANWNTDAPQMTGAAMANA
jgi:hypothetical protein